VSIDEWVVIPSDQLSKEEKSRAGVPRLSELTSIDPRKDEDRSVCVYRFGSDAYHAITSSASGEVVLVEDKGVRYERLGSHLVVVPDNSTSS
jgi:hypothetical protein